MWESVSIRFGLVQDFDGVAVKDGNNPSCNLDGMGER